MTRRGIIKAYAIGGAIAATYYIEPVLTYDLDIFFIPAKEGLDVLSPIHDYAKERGFSTQAEAILIEDFPVQFIPACNELVREAVDKSAALKYRDVEARVVTAPSSRTTSSSCSGSGRPWRNRACRGGCSNAADPG